MNEIVKEIAKNLISDEELMKYSYQGRRKKGRFKDFDNLTRVVVLATIESMKRVHREIFRQEKVETNEEKQQLYNEVMDYFTKEYIKKAENRFNQPIKRVR